MRSRRHARSRPGNGLSARRRSRLRRRNDPGRTLRAGHTAKQAEADGDLQKYFAFRTEAGKCYEEAKELEDLAKQEEGKPFAKKGKNKKAEKN